MRIHDKAEELPGEYARSLVDAEGKAVYYFKPRDQLQSYFR